MNQNGENMESSYDAWRTATPYEDDICRAEFEDDNLSVDTSFIEEEDEEIKSLISSESNKGGENMGFKDEKTIEFCERIFILIAFMDMDAIDNEDVYDTIKELLIGIRFCC